MTGYNCSLTLQQELLWTALSENKVLYEILCEMENAGLEEYYIGAGCICQSLWNFQNGMAPLFGISDIDIVYFDGKDLSSRGEEEVTAWVKNRLGYLPIVLDVNNQARVHLWYEEYFGYGIKPYESLESAINTWPTTATAVGVRLNQGKQTVYAPYGLNDMFGKIVRANKIQITEEIYLKKCERWLKIWPELTIIPWES